MRSFSYTPGITTNTRPHGSVDDRPDVHQLMPYIPPVQRLVGWYDRLADLTRDEPDIFELDEIVVRLQGLPPLPGQLGRDLRLIADATVDTLRADIIDAICRLRRLALLQFEWLDSALDYTADPADSTTHPSRG